MPELPEVEAVRRRLHPAMSGARFDRVELRRSGLRQPFPIDLARRLQGTRVLSLERRGKYLLAALSSGETLLMHLGMSGSFRIGRAARGPAARKAGTRKPPAPDRHDHVVFEMSSGAVVTFNDPRRFGVVDLLAADSVPDHPALGRMGEEPLSTLFDAAALAKRCAGKRTPLKAALLDQRVVAGLGNIYASEALNLARLSPLRRAATIATRSGGPRPNAARLAAAIKAVLREAIARRNGRRYRGSRFRVYEREGEPCPTPGCGGTIRRIVQAGRSTFYCPTCQR